MFYSFWYLTVFTKTSWMLPSNMKCSVLFCS